MVTIKKLKSQVEKANALGRQNLTEKGVELPENATTYEIMEGIADVSSGGGTTEIENLIDESGVLDSTEGSVTEKVEELIDRVKDTNQLTGISCQNNQNIEHFVYDCKGLWNLYHAFYNCNNLKTITLTNTQTVLNWHRTFCGSGNIISIETLDMSKADKDYISGAAAGGWIQAPKLENLKFVPETIKTSITIATCPKLNAESIQSIIDGLATVTTAQTLTLNSAITLTDEQKATINAKGWTLAQ